MSQCRAAIKYASPGNENARLDVQRECKAYGVDIIASSPCFRQCYDIIGDPNKFDDETGGINPILALEWMDITFADVAIAPDMRTHFIIKNIIHTLMLSFICLDRAKIVNTGTTLPVFFYQHCLSLMESDIKPANVLLSGIDTGHLVVKVADLGLSEQASQTNMILN